MPILVVTLSVHHTGTHFVYNHLLSEERGWEYVVPNPYTDDAFKDLTKGKKGKVQLHIDGPFMDRVHVWAKRFPSIVPLRHPRAVAQSWKARKKDLNWLSFQWSLLKNEVDPYGPYYLPLSDSELNDEYLAELERGLGIRLIHDWSVVHDPGIPTKDEVVELDEQEEEFVKHWMEDGFFERFGYEY